MTSVTVEIGCSKTRICVDFPYDEVVVRKVRTIDGRNYVKTPRKHWHVPLDMNTCRKLRQAFGDQLQIGPQLHSWATVASREEAALGTLALADTAELVRLPKVLPTLARAMHVGPIGLTFTEDAQWEAALAGPGSFQAADVRFLVESAAPLNANQQGLGKTPEWIAAVWEGGWQTGNHLVVAPAAAVEGTWESELEKWQADAPVDVGIFCCTGTAAERRATLDDWMDSTATIKWVVVNPEMLRWKKDPSCMSTLIVNVPPSTKAALEACRCEASKQPHTHYVKTFPQLDIVWDTYCVDECHKNSIRNHRSITSKSLRAVRYSKKRCAMSGTPAKKKGADVWGVLNWLRPDTFTSFWRFAGAYFEIEDNGFGKKVLGLLEDRQEEFFNALKPYTLRRTKAECAPWLPPKMYVDVWCHMGEAQAKAYESMKEDGYANLEGDEVTTTGVLAEFTRLTQFATALCVLREDGKVVPTTTSCKVDAMLAKMDEAGMFDEDNTDKQIVFSQSRELVELVADLLNSKGLKTVIVSGKQNKKGERRRIKEEFQTGDTRVLCIVTQAGGVSLTLDAADVAHFLDEPWAPDETEQAEDRIHRVSRVHQVTIYMYRTQDTIDEYRKSTAFEKSEAHKLIWDVRREILRAEGRTA